jgi:hypothetical protein
MEDQLLYLLDDLANVPADGRAERLAFLGC